MSQSATTPKVDIDQRTKDELQPPCEGRWPSGDKHLPCSDVAEWICNVACETCGGRVTLDCTAHLKAFTTVGILCRRCADRRHAARLTLLSAEPLR